MWPLFTAEHGDSTRARLERRLANAAAGSDLHEPSGALVRTIQTGRYRPTHLTCA